MAAAVAAPLSILNGELPGVLPPSAVMQHLPRHGRRRGMSMKGKGSRQRGYSVVEEHDVAVAKALMFVVKRAIQKEEVEDGAEGEYLVADPEGWVDVADVVCIGTYQNGMHSYWETNQMDSRHLARPLPHIGLGRHL